MAGIHIRRGKQGMHIVMHHLGIPSLTIVHFRLLLALTCNSHATLRAVLQSTLTLHFIPNLLQI